MRYFRKPYVLLDFNLFKWIPDIDLSLTNTKEPSKDKFIRAEEQRAFQELLKMKSRKQIEMGMPNILPENMVRELDKGPGILEKAKSFFLDKMLLIEIVGMEGSEREEKAKRSSDILYLKVENDPNSEHDDPELYVLAMLVTPDVTHLATCDMNFIKNSEKYKEALVNDNEVVKYIIVLRRNKELIVDLPSKILDNIKSGLKKKKE
jgi:hypothetical protein